MQWAPDYDLDSDVQAFERHVDKSSGTDEQNCGGGATIEEREGHSPHQADAADHALGRAEVATRPQGKVKENCSWDEQPQQGFHEGWPEPHRITASSLSLLLELPKTMRESARNVNMWSLSEPFWGSSVSVARRPFLICCTLRDFPAKSSHEDVRESSAPMSVRSRPQACPIETLIFFGRGSVLGSKSAFILVFRRIGGGRGGSAAPGGRCPFPPTCLMRAKRPPPRAAGLLLPCAADELSASPGVGDGACLLLGVAAFKASCIAAVVVARSKPGEGGVGGGRKDCRFSCLRRSASRSGERARDGEPDDVGERRRRLLRCLLDLDIVLDLCRRSLVAGWG